MTDDNRSASIANVWKLFLLPWLIWSSGFTLAKVWAWYLVPIGVPAISRIAGVGIIFVVDIIRYNPRLPKSTADDEWRSVVGMIVGPWVIFFFAWLVIRLFG